MTFMILKQKLETFFQNKLLIWLDDINSMPFIYLFRVDEQLFYSTFCMKMLEISYK